MEYSIFKSSSKRSLSRFYTCVIYFDLDGLATTCRSYRAIVSCSQLARTSHLGSVGPPISLPRGRVRFFTTPACFHYPSHSTNSWKAFLPLYFVNFSVFFAPIQPSFVFCILVWENRFSVCIDGEILRYAATGTRSSHLTYFFLLLFLTHSWTQLLKVPPIRKTRSGLQRLVIFSLTLMSNWQLSENYVSDI